MKICRASLLVGTGCVALASAPAHASVDEYSVGGESTVGISLEVCSAETQLAVRGDTGTDLDFVVTDPSGTTVHTDQGVDDFISLVLEKDGNDCETFGLGISNLGEETNTFTVVLEPILEDSTRIEKFIIGANETQTIDFKACGTSAQVTARGDGDTDLDFIIRNSDEAVVHEDDDLSDETTATLAGLLSDCETFEMEVANLGAVYNALMVVVEPEGAPIQTFAGTQPSTTLVSGVAGAPAEAAGEGAGEYRANANSAIRVDLPVCGATRLEVRGDGDTDLDFSIDDSDGNTVFSDYDLSDVTFTTLEPSGGCETFEMEVSNLGDVYNVFTVALTDASEERPVSGAGEYRVNANAATKVPLRVCSMTNVFVRGDGDTDLDYDVTDGSGSSVHSNYDYSDQTQFTLRPDDGCADYSLSVSNLGSVWNLMTITFEDGPDIVALPDAPAAVPPPPITISPAPTAPPPIRTIPPPAPPAPSPRNAELVGSGPGSYRAGARSMVRVELPVCDRTFLSVEGDGDTDLDFDITNANGESVHSNYDFSDRTSTALTPADGCETFSMTVDNLGGVYNQFAVTYETIGGGATGTGGSGTATSTFVEVPPDNASTDGNNRNIAILNQTGETLNFIYWSNSATLEWGEDKLGSSSVLAAGQQWNVNAGDGSNACLFDFKAVTASGREIQVTRANVCEVTSVAFE